MEERQEGNANGANITFEDLGITRGPQLADTPLGKRREIKDLSKKEIIFAVISLGSLLATLVMTIYKLATITEKSSTNYTFAIVLLINTVFCFYYIIHGILHERPYEIGVLVIATFIVWIYIILNFAQAHQDKVKMARLIIASVLSPCIIVLGLLIAKQYHDSGRLIFRTVGASSEDQNMCKNMFFYFGLLKFDLQLALSMVVLILNNGLKVDTEDIIILPVGIVFSIIAFIIGYLCVRTENKILAVVFAVSLTLQPAYVIYKVITSAQSMEKVHNTDNTEAIAVTTFTCAALSLVIRIAVVVFFVIVFRNFGNGLKEKVYGTQSNFGTQTIHGTQEGDLQEEGPIQ